MSGAVSRVTIHHQGGGAPTDNSSGYSGGGYTYGIGATRWERFRDVWSSYATKNYNGESVDVCLSGSRGNTSPAYPVTDADLRMIRDALADARARGYVVNAPEVVAHRNSPGSSTACPGDNAMARWSEIVAACQASGSAPAPPSSTGGDELPKDKDVVDALVTSEGSWQLQYDGGVLTKRGPFYGSYFSLPASVRNDPARRFRNITAPGDGSARGYDLVSVKGEVYGMRTKQ